MRLCSTDGCIRKHYARNLCRRHYRELWKGIPREARKTRGICLRGHVSSLSPLGRDSDYGCKECKKDRTAMWVLANPHRRRERERKRYAANREEINAKNRAWLQANHEHVRIRNVKYRGRYTEKRKEWAAKNKGRLRELGNAWLRAHPEKRSAKEARRRARKLSQLCSCCTAEQLRSIYATAHKQGYVVDHKQALALGGLHCIKNLQVLAPSEHYRKTVEWDLPLIATARGN